MENGCEGSCEQTRVGAFRDELEALGSRFDGMDRENDVMRRQLDMVQGIIEIFRSGRGGQCMTGPDSGSRGLLMRYDAALNEAKKVDTGTRPLPDTNF